MPLKKDSFDSFHKWQLNLWKQEKVEKVMKLSHEIWKLKSSKEYEPWNDTHG